VANSTSQHAALVYWNMVQHPIPILDDEKKAAIKWEPYQKKRPTQQEIRQWWPPGSRKNIALVLGPIPRLLVLNVNQKHGDDGLSTLRRHGWTIPPTPTILTRMTASPISSNHPTASGIPSHSTRTPL